MRVEGRDAQSRVGGDTVLALGFVELGRCLHPVRPVEAFPRAGVDAAVDAEPAEAEECREHVDGQGPPVG